MAEPFLLDAQGKCYPSGSSSLMEEACTSCEGFEPSSKTGFAIEPSSKFLFANKYKRVMEACAGCGATPEDTTTLYRCSRCMLACYCSEDCQIIHSDPWKADGVHEVLAEGHWGYCYRPQLTTVPCTRWATPERQIDAIIRRLNHLKKKIPVGLQEDGVLFVRTTTPVVKFSAALANGVYCQLTFKEDSTAKSTPVTLELELDEEGKEVPAYEKVFPSKAAAVRWIDNADQDFASFQSSRHQQQLYPR